jgi:hypothetical protein
LRHNIAAYSFIRLQMDWKDLVKQTRLGIVVLNELSRVNDLRYIFSCVYLICVCMGRHT